MRLNITATPEFSVNNLKFSAVTAVEQGKIPAHFQLFDNYPNPFNPSTAIEFNLPSKFFVTLKIFDIIGREIATVVSGELEGGNHTVQWNAQGFPSGVYYYTIQAGNFIKTKKLMILK